MRFFTALLVTLAPAFAHATLSLSKSFVSLSARAGFSSSDTVYVSNSGMANIDVRISNGCFGEFYVFDTCMGTLRPHMQCNIRITFNPRTRGYRSCNITVSGNPGGSRFLSVSGQGY